MSDVNEITPDTLKEIVAGLKTQEKMERVKTSESLGKLKDWIVENGTADPYITPIDKKCNPFNEKSGKCILT